MQEPRRPAPDAPGTPSKGVVAITGIGGNIGPTVAHAFRDRGWRLALIDSGRNAERLHDVFPDEVLTMADLSRPDAAARAVHAIEERVGGIDALAHLAGGFATASATGTDVELVDRMLSRNLRTLEITVRAVLPGMLERGRGTILGVAARQAVEGGRNVTAYAAAKAAVLGYLRALGTEVGRRGVGVGAVIPMGTIDTPENRMAMPHADPHGWIAPEEMAAALVYLAEGTPRGHVGELRVAAVPVDR